MSDLSKAAYVILGLLDAQPRSGYEIKRVVDASTRFFWAASYGQIYPELRRLRELGLISSERDDAGERKRALHRLTPAGRKVLREWLQRPAAPTELRDEKLLKLFFSDCAGSGGRQAALAALEARRAEHAAVAEELRGLEPMVTAAAKPGKLAVLRYGIECNERGARLCERLAAELERDHRESA